LAQQKKARKVGRPKLPKGEAKGRIVPVRFTPDDLKAIAVKAKANKQTVSHWIRSIIMATNVLAHCDACNKKVTALVMVPPDELIETLQKPGSVRVMHFGDDGDHIWTLSETEKDNLRNAVAKGAV
jgi:hypothetical protein